MVGQYLHRGPGCKCSTERPGPFLPCKYPSLLCRLVAQLSTSLKLFFFSLFFLLLYDLSQHLFHLMHYIMDMLSLLHISVYYFYDLHM